MACIQGIKEKSFFYFSIKENYFLKGVGMKYLTMYLRSTFLVLFMFNALLAKNEVSEVNIEEFQQEGLVDNQDAYAKLRGKPCCKNNCKTEYCVGLQGRPGTPGTAGTPGTLPDPATPGTPGTAGTMGIPGTPGTAGVCPGLSSRNAR